VDSNINYQINLKSLHQQVTPQLDDYE